MSGRKSSDIEIKMWTEHKDGTRTHINFTPHSGIWTEESILSAIKSIHVNRFTEMNSGNYEIKVVKNGVN